MRDPRSLRYKYWETDHSDDLKSSRVARCWTAAVLRIIPYSAVDDTGDAVQKQECLQEGVQSGHDYPM